MYRNMTLSPGSAINNSVAANRNVTSLDANGVNNINNINNNNTSSLDNNNSMGNRFFQVRTPFNSHAISHNPVSMTTSIVSTSPRVNVGDVAAAAAGGGAVCFGVFINYLLINP